MIDLIGVGGLRFATLAQASTQADECARALAGTG